MSMAYDLNQIVNGHDKQTNFTTRLLKLLLKVDEANKEKLRLGFPNAVSTIEHWRSTGDILDLEYD